MKKLLILSCAMLLLCVATLVAEDDDTRIVKPILEPQDLSPPMPSAMETCILQKTILDPTHFSASTEGGWGFLTYFDPAAECASNPVYPFELTTAFIYLFDYATSGNLDWPVLIEVVVYNATDRCSGPGAELCSFSLWADRETFENTVVPVEFPELCCISGPVFIGLSWLSGQPERTPTFAMDDKSLNPVEACDCWVSSGGPFWQEWHSFWPSPAPGYPVFYAEGRTYSSACDKPCFWGPGYPHKMHYAQLPDSSGWDVNATTPMVLADDWECTETGWVKDIFWWGSWYHGYPGVIDHFVLSVHEDIPADQSPTQYSMPGATLWELDVYDFGMTEFEVHGPEPGGWYDPACDSTWANGDVNCDGAALNYGDWLALDSGLYHGKTPCPDFFVNSDLNGDCRVDRRDLTVFNNYLSIGMDAFLPYGGHPVPSCCGSKEIVWADGGSYFRYDVCLDAPDWFWQDSGTIYWLSISAVTEDTIFEWGWKASIDHFNDDAVWAYSDDPDWRELYEPEYGMVDSDSFWVTIESDGFLSVYGGTDYYGDGWYEYPSDWLNIWFYDHPFDYTRYKIIHIEADIEPYDWGPPMWIEFAVNWSTPWWSLAGNPPEAERIPPLPGVDEEMAIGRYTFLADNFAAGHYQWDFMIPDYNPEWVSIDVRGYNFQIENGVIEHECLSSLHPGTQSLDLAFVVAGDSIVEADSGACIYREPPYTEFLCIETTEDECDALGGAYRGTGTSCTDLEACCQWTTDECIMADYVSCINDLDGIPQGFGTVCTVTEACALPLDECGDLDPLCCEQLGGTPLGPGTACGPIQACCILTHLCLEIDPTVCILYRDGVPQGLGAHCSLDQRACCLSPGYCVPSDSVCCVNELGGVPGQIGEECTDQEACCFPDSTCAQMDPFCCELEGGTPMGPGTHCATVTCGDVGACCPGDGTCLLLSEQECLDLGDEAVYRGNGTSCGGDSEPNGYDDACECCGLYTGGITGNCNCSSDGKLTLSDISRLIDRVYISKALLCCEPNGNTNASADCLITLSDITRLIDAVYISKIAPPACMPSCY